MNIAEKIIYKFGGQSMVAQLIGKGQSTVQYWTKAGRIPSKWQSELLRLAQEHGINLVPSDFVLDGEEIVIEIPKTLPEARYPGTLRLGNSSVDCYVLSTGERVISLRATIKAIAGKERGDLAGYIGAKALKPYINSELVLAETIEFNMPGTQLTGKGIKAESFLDICNAYVGALSEGTLETERQHEIAIKCSMLLSACAKVGLIALIDEVTGYQYDRAQDALTFKLKLFLEEEMHAWEKTFPDELWEEFGRLTNWSGPLRLRPKYWGKLVMELVYGYLDKDVAAWLKNHAPKPKVGMNYHQWLSSQYGLKKLTEHIWMLIGMARSCFTMRELREKMAYQYGRQPLQLNLFIPAANNK